MVQQFCGSCHLPPPPEVLPREKWEFVIDWMGNFLGHQNRTGPLSHLVSHRQIPREPVLSRAQLEKIREFYRRKAPPRLTPSKTGAEVREGIPWFRVRPTRLLESRTPLVTLLKIDETHRRLFVGDGERLELLVFDENGTLRERHKVGSQPVAIHLENRNFFLTLIGDLDRDRRRGQIISYTWKGDQYQLKELLGGYFRTSHVAFEDLNGDGRRDFLVSAFGDYDQGRLAWFENQGEDHYREHILLPRSGTLKSVIADLTGDGAPDILSLVAQGRNEILLFENLGSGEFHRRQLLEEHPAFGFNDFQLVDFNGDGFLDLITANGNNMEIPDPPLRPYHGIRLYLNDGRFNLRSAFFYPFPGAMRVVAADFTADGLLDLAATSYFPDWSDERPHGFVFLENRGSAFVPYTLRESQGGRWLSLDAGDLDGDGDLELVLGSGFNLSAVPERVHARLRATAAQTLPVLLLENVGRGHRLNF